MPLLTVWSTGTQKTLVTGSAESLLAAVKVPVFGNSSIALGLGVKTAVMFYRFELLRERTAASSKGLELPGFQGHTSAIAIRIQEVKRNYLTYFQEDLVTSVLKQ